MDAADFTALVVPKRGQRLPPLPSSELPALYICSETEDFRLVAKRAPLLDGSIVVEVGASYGVCSRVLARRAARVVGIDSAAIPLCAARELCSTMPHCEFHLISARDRPSLIGLLRRCRGGSVRRCLFIDIGGDGLLRHVAPLVALCMAHLGPNLCCVKSRSLWNFFSAKQLQVAEGNFPRWSELKPAVWQTGDGCEAERPSAFDNKRYRRAAVPAAAVGFRYALDYEPRRSAHSGALICRFHNFYSAGCTRAHCEYDHVCFFCDSGGHRAMDSVCTGGEVSPPSSPSEKAVDTAAAAIAQLQLAAEL
mmetsp:Transcript_39573/g.77347  ORF Transcript_39573/g.77347 Transcript_39573/m.77347 type:complete len:308 (-) Transcript_39573:31-954(-)